MDLGLLTTAVSPSNTLQIQLVKEEVKQEQPKQKPKIKEYTVKDGDTLEKIAKNNKTTWKRLFDKNKNIKHPDLIKAGDKLVIPTKDEELASRDYVIVRDVQEPISEQNVEPASPVYATQANTGLIAGTIGYALPYGNCVNEPGVNNPGWGNPIDWPVLSNTPTIGATALWKYNHTGVISGLYANGDVEVRHQNYSYPQTRFSISEFRGFR